jgi:hypothetical protein
MNDVSFLTMLVARSSSLFAKTGGCGEGICMRLQSKSGEINFPQSAFVAAATSRSGMRKAARN